jgi:hypothetical protein
MHEKISAFGGIANYGLYMHYIVGRLETVVSRSRCFRLRGGLAPDNFEANRAMTLQPPPLRHASFFVRFWRGQYALPISWTVGVLINLGTIGAIMLLAFATREQAFNPYAIAITLFVMWGATAIITVYQSVGVWRSAARFRRTGGRRIWRGLCSLAAQLCVLAVVASFTYHLWQSGVRQIDESWRMAFEDDPDIPPFTLRTMRDGTEMEIAGGFKFGLTRAARAAIDGSPNLKVVHLMSSGGRIGEARELARLIADRGLSTYTATVCMSACTLAFIAGRERFLKAGGKLGFHRAAFAGVENSDAMSTLLLGAGIERPFVDRVVAQPASGMWYPTTGELQASHVVTALVDNRRFAASGLGADPRPADFARDLRAIGVYRTFEEIDFRLFKRLIEEYQRGYELGQSEGDIQDRLGGMVAPRIRAQIARADDAVLIDYANLMADQYAAVGAKNARTCFLRITRGATPEEEALMTPELRAREQALQVRALRSSRPRTPVPPDLLQADYAVVFKQLGERYSQDELQMFGHAEKVAPAQYATYCRLATAIFRGIAALPPMRAGDVMSAMFTSMSAARPEK